MKRLAKIKLIITKLINSELLAMSMLAVGCGIIFASKILTRKINILRFLSESRVT
jgi:hypothetical protein